MSTASTANESAIVKRILGKLNALPRTYAHKVHGGPYGGGQPDIDASIGGRAVKIEVKKPGGKATPLQAQMIDRWTAAHAVAFVAHSWEEVVDELIARGCTHPYASAPVVDPIHQVLAEAGLFTLH